MDRLRSLGLNQALLAQVPYDDLDADRLGRVIFQSRGHSIVATERADHLARAHPRFDDGCVVGDWVLLETSGDPSWIVRRLDRIHTLARRDPDRGVQVMCAHVDLLLVTTALDRDLNARRLERYLAVAAEAAIPCALVLTKMDLSPDAVAPTFAAWRDRFTSLFAVSTLAGQGVDALRAAVPSGTTAALLGSSGVGKSTLVNALTGSALPTREIRADDHRGRHTTTERRLVRLPGGGWLVDNPGLRQVGPIGEAGVAEVFADVQAIGAQCRFRDCSHGGEPGCAIEEAIACGSLDPARYAAWVKLQRELAYELRRIDRDAERAERERWKRIHRDQREREAFRRRNE